MGSECYALSEIDIIKADRIHGMMPPWALFFFAKEAKRSKSVVEVGCWRGKTTRALCDNCDGEVHAVDTWLGSPGLMVELNFMREYTGDDDWLFHEFMGNVEDCGNLSILRMSSLAAASYFHSQGKTFDMIILDAAHDYENVKADIKAWYPLLNPSGWLFGDDYQHEDVRKAVDEFFNIGEHQPLDSRLWGVPAGQSKAA